MVLLRWWCEKLNQQAWIIGDHTSYPDQLGLLSQTIFTMSYAPSTIVGVAKLYNVKFTHPVDILIGETGLGVKAARAALEALPNAEKTRITTKADEIKARQTVDLLEKIRDAPVFIPEHDRVVVRTIQRRSKGHISLYKETLKTISKLPAACVVPLAHTPEVESPAATQEDPSSPLPEDLSSPLHEAPSSPLPEAPSSPLPEDLSSPLPEAPSSPLPEAPSSPLPEAPSSPLPEAPSSPLPEAPSSPLPEAPSTPPVKVKKVMTRYNAFIKTVLIVARETSGLPHAEALKTVAAIWRVLPESVKNGFQDIVDIDQERHDEETMAALFA